MFAATSRSKSAPSSQLVSVRLPVELLERLADVGNVQGLAMSDTIRLVLERGLSAKKKGK
jgi:antitoxin component of RelBE/YafQ-DinJ toxin-antitoxin module